MLRHLTDFDATSVNVLSRTVAIASANPGRPQFRGCVGRENQRTSQDGDN